MSCVANAFLPRGLGGRRLRRGVGAVFFDGVEEGGVDWTDQVVQGAVGRRRVWPYPLLTSEVRRRPLAAEGADDRGDLASGALVAGAGDGVERVVRGLPTLTSAMLCAVFCAGAEEGVEEGVAAADADDARGDEAEVGEAALEAARQVAGQRAQALVARRGLAADDDGALAVGAAQDGGWAPLARASSAAGSGLSSRPGRRA